MVFLRFRELGHIVVLNCLRSDNSPVDIVEKVYAQSMDPLLKYLLSSSKWGAVSEFYKRFRDGVTLHSCSASSTSLVPTWANQNLILNKLTNNQCRISKPSSLRVISIHVLNGKQHRNPFLPTYRQHLLQTAITLLLLYTNIDQTLVNSLHRLLNCEIGALDCHIITTENITCVHCIHIYYLICDVFVHVIYSGVSGQCSYTIS